MYEGEREGRLKRGKVLRIPAKYDVGDVFGAASSR